jgi:hypothetical protein
LLFWYFDPDYAVLRCFFWAWGYGEQEEEALIEQQLAEYRSNGNTANLPPELKLMGSAVSLLPIFAGYASCLISTSIMTKISALEPQFTPCPSISL